MDDDPWFGLTAAAQSRICAAFNEINHRRRKKQIGWSLCIREAYLVCAREGLPPESAVTMVVRLGRTRKLKWLDEYRPTGRPAVGYFAGFAPASPLLEPAYQPISESEQRPAIIQFVADLMQAEAARVAAKQMPARYPRRAAWLRDRLEERGWGSHDLEAEGGPNHETTYRILQGAWVQNRSLQKLARTLKIKVNEIPDG
jgi:hypothetical protein